MEIKPPTNTTLGHMAEVILESESTAICGHVNPDGDCIGSALALHSALKELGKDVCPLLPSADDLHPAIAALPGAEDLVSADEVSGGFDLFISVDVSGSVRIGEAAAALKAAAPQTITIDHHEVDETGSDLSFVVPDAPSTTMLIWDLVRELGLEPTPAVATCCYFGLMTDTGGFRHANSNAIAFSYAAAMVEAGADPQRLSEAFFQRRSLPSILLEELTIDHMELFCDGHAVMSFVTQEDLDAVGAVRSDTEPLIDLLRSIDGVQVCCLLKVFGPDVRGSLRSKDDIDVNSIARKLGGGGHRLAAGFTLPCPLDEARERVRELIEAALS